MTGSLPTPGDVVPGSARRQDGMYELKFRLGPDEACFVEKWARQHLQPDPHGVAGAYRTTTLYVDTPDFDIFHRTPGNRRSKYRLRRYGSGEVVFLEKKMKQGGVVCKQRHPIALAQVANLPAAAPAPAGWFLTLLHERQLNPVCRIAYDRSAFFGQTTCGSVRLTLDRNLSGVPEAGWSVAPVNAGRVLLAEAAILELKFRTMPALFRDLLPRLPSRQAGVSKYRLCLQSWNIAGERF